MNESIKFTAHTLFIFAIAETFPLAKIKPIAASIRLCFKNAMAKVSIANGSSSYDLVIVGGGPAGIGAAVAAGRMGVSTALIERHDILGGMGTAALVNNFCPAHLDGNRLIIGGVFAELRQRLIDAKAIFTTVGYRYAMEPYSPHVFAGIAKDLVQTAGVDILFNSKIRDVATTNEGRIQFSLDSHHLIESNFVVDATGDALVAAKTGVPFSFGRSSDRAVMPLTYCYKLGPIDLERIKEEMPASLRHDPHTNQPVFFLSGAHQEVASAQANGELSIPRDHISAILNIPGEPENATVNFGRVFIKDPTDPAELDRAEEEGKQQIEEGLLFFRKYLPGFEKAEILERARQIGVRESRQIKGLYTLTGEDVLSCRQFDDVIAQCCYAVDVHSPESNTTQMTELERGTHFDIPWRCLIPAEGPENLVVAGRCISATQEAMSSFRVAPSAMAIGEAAGVTSAIAVIRRTPLRELDPALVQEQLRNTGAILD